MENYGTTMKICCSEAINAACERRGIDISRIEVFDGFSPPLPILTTDTSSLGGKHLRITGKIHIFNILIFPETSAYWLGKKRTFRGIESCKFLSIFVELGIGFLNCDYYYLRNHPKETILPKVRYIWISIYNWRQRYKRFVETSNVIRVANQSLKVIAKVHSLREPFAFSVARLKGKIETGPSVIHSSGSDNG